MGFGFRAGAGRRCPHREARLGTRSSVGPTPELADRLYRDCLQPRERSANEKLVASRSTSTRTCGETSSSNRDYLP